MIRWTIVLCLGLYLTLQLGGEDRGQKRLGLMEAEQEAMAAAAKQANPEMVEASKVAAIAPDVAPAPVVDVAFAPTAALINASVTDADPTPAPSPAADLAASSDNALGQIMYVTGRSVNVRGGPSTRNAVVGKLGRGDAVSVVWVEENGWARIRVEGDGVDGYMSLSFLTETDPAN